MGYVQIRCRWGTCMIVNAHVQFFKYGNWTEVVLIVLHHLDAFAWILNKSSPLNLGRVHHHPHDRECASCAMYTADKSSHSAAGTLHPYYSATFFLHCVVWFPTSKNKFAPSHWGSSIVNPRCLATEWTQWGVGDKGKRRMVYPVNAYQTFWTRGLVWTTSKE